MLLTATLAALVISVVLHEIAHGVAAYFCGDDTAYRAGRLNPNPIKHVDPLGSIGLPLVLFLTHAPFMFGYAKPVPVRFDRLRHPRLDTAIVAAAGPFTNLVLAVIAAFALHLLPEASAQEEEGWMQAFLTTMVILNLMLMWFNLLPVLPLDGGRIAFSFAPSSWARFMPVLERAGMVAVIGLLFILPALLAQFGVEFDVAKPLLLEPVLKMAEWLLKATGHS